MNFVTKALHLNYHPAAIALGGFTTFGSLCYLDTRPRQAVVPMCDLADNSHNYPFPGVIRQTPNYDANLFCSLLGLGGGLATGLYFGTHVFKSLLSDPPIVASGCMCGANN